MSYFDNCSSQIIKVNMGTIEGLGGKSTVIGFGFVNAKGRRVAQLSTKR